MRLLSHPENKIASAAAIGEWRAEPKGEVRPSLRESWQRAMLRCSGDEWELREILKGDRALAVEWLGQCLKDNRELWRHDEIIDAAIEGLEIEDRRELLGTLPENVSPPDVVQQLVGESIELFRLLLQVNNLKRLHLAPLMGHPNPTGWATKAEVALDAGYSANEVAEAAFGYSWSWSGSESAMWNEWAERFGDLGSHTSARVREIGAIGREVATDRRDGAQERERQERIRGR
jgi:hypothetical protein